MPAKKSVAKKAVKSTTKKVAKKVAAKKAASPQKAPPPKKTSASKTAPAKKTPASAGFSLEDALSIANSRKVEEDAIAKKKAAKERAQKEIEDAEQKAEARVLGAASLSDILGFDPMSSTESPIETRKVPKKHQAFYDLLIELRDHVKTGLSMHTEETLKRSSKDDAGDLSGYSQHMADAGTDTFDRDFALSMVSSEQDALTEIEAAIERIFSGKYGVCEMTGQPIDNERLMAVPFTRYSVETQKQLEKNQTRSVQRGGVFAEASSEDAMTFSDGDSE
jgi:RNA polymerase-binding transcription factor DksA